jgi:hypothetical protein
MNARMFSATVQAHATATHSVNNVNNVLHLQVLQAGCLMRGVVVSVQLLQHVHHSLVEHLDEILVRFVLFDCSKGGQGAGRHPFTTKHSARLSPQRQGPAAGLTRLLAYEKRLIPLDDAPAMTPKPGITFAHRHSLTNEAVTLEQHDKRCTPSQSR